MDDKGKRVERRWGWDCHGLPAELFVEKKLGIANKKEIGTKISIEDYVRECRAAMVKTGTEWEDTIDRLGRWVEFENAYQTMDNEYMESVWWAFKRLYEDGKIYDGRKDFGVLQLPKMQRRSASPKLPWKTAIKWILTQACSCTSNLKTATNICLPGQRHHGHQTSLVLRSVAFVYFVPVTY